MKDAYWFPHDSNATSDPKMMALIRAHGWSGYGLFWRMVEIMRESEGYRLELARVADIAYTSRADELPQVVETCCSVGLFAKDDTHLWSESLLRRMALREAQREGGRRGGNMRWYGKPKAGHKEANSHPIPMTGQNKTEQDKTLEERRAYGARVRLSDAEYKTLRGALGESGLSKYIGSVNDYCTSKGHAYKDYAAAIRNFARRDNAWPDRAPPGKALSVACPVCGKEPAGTESFCRQCGLERSAWKDVAAVADARLRWQKREAS